MRFWSLWKHAVTGEKLQRLHLRETAFSAWIAFTENNRSAAKKAGEAIRQRDLKVAALAMSAWEDVTTQNAALSQKVKQIHSPKKIAEGAMPTWNTVNYGVRGLKPLKCIKGP